MTPVVYDAGVLIAADRNDRAVWADHRIRLEAGIIPVVPAPVIAQVSRSPAQVQLRRLCADARSPASPNTKHTPPANSWAAPQPATSSTPPLPRQPPTCEPTSSPATAPTSAASSKPRRHKPDHRPIATPDQPRTRLPRQHKRCCPLDPEPASTQLGVPIRAGLASALDHGVDPGQVLVGVRAAHVNDDCGGELLDPARSYRAGSGARRHVRRRPAGVPGSQASSSPAGRPPIGPQRTSTRADTLSGILGFAPEMMTGTRTGQHAAPGSAQQPGPDRRA